MPNNAERLIDNALKQITVARLQLLNGKGEVVYESEQPIHGVYNGGTINVEPFTIVVAKVEELS